MKKCDVIIPVYKSPEWVKLCVYAVMKNTNEKYLNKIYLINDCNDELTINCLKNLKKKYGTKIIIEQNEKNMGFVKTTNKGLKLSNADYALLLNTDCIVSEGTIEKLIWHMEQDKKIGLICPISSNAANLTLEMFEGFSFSQMNSLLEHKFKGERFDACTVVGNCLMISKECLDKTGLLDEAYGMGYGEETDYQFKAMSKGFSAKVAIDTYVFHKAEVSFGTSKEKQERLSKNRELFFSRWGEEYNKLNSMYIKNDPIKYIKDKITEEDKSIKTDTLFYLNGIVQNAGGVHVVVDIVNYLSINNQNVNILYDIMGDYQEIMLFKPISSSNIDNVSSKKIVSTIYSSVYSAKEIAKKKNMKLISFVQGYETYFENGSVYGITELSYKLPNAILTISNYLKDELKNVFGKESTLIKNSINYDLIHSKNNNNKIKTITIVLRNSVMKGDWILLDIIKKINNNFNNLEINVVYMDEYICFPEITNSTIKLNKILGPVSRLDIISLMQKTDVYIDASLSEGFGLTALEAMTAGAVAIVSNSRGINDYIINDVNGYVIDEVNNSDKYIECLNVLISDKNKFKEFKKYNESLCEKFDIDFAANEYIEYFNSNDIFNLIPERLNKEEKIIYEAMIKKNTNEVKGKRKIYYISKIIPKFLKNGIKKIVNFLYGCYQH